MHFSASNYFCYEILVITVTAFESAQYFRKRSLSNKYLNDKFTEKLQNNLNKLLFLQRSETEAKSAKLLEIHLVAGSNIFTTLSLVCSFQKDFRAPLARRGKVPLSCTGRTKKQCARAVLLPSKTSDCVPLSIVFSFCRTLSRQPLFLTLSEKPPRLINFNHPKPSNKSKLECHHNVFNYYRPVKKLFS